MQAAAAADPTGGMDRVLSLVASVYDVPHRDLAHRRSNKTARARAVAIYLAHTVLSMSFSRIGDLLDRHPTTAFYAVRRVEALRDEDMKTDQLISWLESVLDAHKETGR